MCTVNAVRQSCLALLPWVVLSQPLHAAENFTPMDGIPAADVLGSHDIWDNPTFIGGITNKGPDSQSVW
jgi:hypothetical protein